MGGVLLVARSRLRANVLASVLLIVLAGIGGGVVMASIAGIRRADAAWDRLQAENPLGDAGLLIVGPDGQPRSNAQYDLDDEIDDVVDLEGVAAASRLTFVTGLLDGPDELRAPVAPTVYLDDLDPAVVGRPVIVQGRMARADAADEAVIDELMADRLGVDVGDQVDFTPFRFAELQASSDGRDLSPDGDTGGLTIVGIVRQPVDLLPPRTDQYALYADEPYLLLTPAWWDANGPDIANYGVFVLVDLDDATTFPTFEHEVAEHFGSSASAFPAVDEIGVSADTRRAVDRQISAEGRAVAAFAIAAALAAAALLALALGRQLGAESIDHRDLQALGLTRSALIGINVLRSLVIAVGAGIVAVIVLIAMSLLLPVGVGRRTLRHTGMSLDGTVAALGVLAVTLLVVGLVALVGWRVSRRDRPRSSGPSFIDRLAGSRRSVPATVGVRLALDPHPDGRAGLTASGVGVLAVAVVVGAAGLLTSFSALRASPARLGQVWDATAGNFADHDSLIDGVNELRERGDVDAIAGELSMSVEIRGEPLTAVAYVPFRGTLPTTIAEGREVEDEDEIVVGENLAEDLDLAVGDQVLMTVPFDDEPRPMEVVGIGPVAAMGIELDPGRAVRVHPELGARDETALLSVLLVRFSPGVDREAAVGSLKEEFPFTVLVSPVPSRSVQTMSGLRILPIALATTVTVLALAALVNAVLASVRRGRRDLAVLKALGLSAGGVRRALRYQSLTWATVVVVVGIPAGLFVTIVGWRQVLGSLGLEAPLVVPVAAVVVAIVAVPAVFVALTWWPARRAAATPAAVTLRSE
ncbi:MAG: ABC transporter permease [Acidimicrobiales bacterium]